MLSRPETRPPKSTNTLKSSTEKNVSENFFIVYTYRSSLYTKSPKLRHGSSYQNSAQSSELEIPETSNGVDSVVDIYDR